ncbi:MAG: cell division protein ZapA [Phascolarctobacterium sp.]|nr:cell division protein ZapA [Phascolarctobacterium sp.]
MGSVIVKIFNESYTLKTDANASAVAIIANDVDKRMTELAKKKPDMDAQRIAVWTALNLAAEYAELKEKHEKLLKALEDEV